MTDVLGTSAFYHDSAACLVRDGDILVGSLEPEIVNSQWSSIRGGLRSPVYQSAGSVGIRASLTGHSTRFGVA